MTTAIVVTARMGSTRLPGKARADLDGAPFIERVLSRVATATPDAEVVLATTERPEDEALANIAKQLGFRAYPGSVDDVAGRVLAAAPDADVLVRVTGDNPFTDPWALRTLLAIQAAHGADYVRMEGMPLGVTPEVLRRRVLERVRATLPEASREYLMFHVFDPARFDCHVVEPDPSLRAPDLSWTVDTQAELDAVRALISDVGGWSRSGYVQLRAACLAGRHPRLAVDPEAPVRTADGTTVSFRRYRSDIMAPRIAASRRHDLTGIPYGAA